MTGLTKPWIATLETLAAKEADADSFKDLARRNILETDAELPGKKRIPHAQR